MKEHTKFLINLIILVIDNKEEQRLILGEFIKNKGW